MTDSEPQMMTPAEAFKAARESFLHAERVSVDAIAAAAPDSAALFGLADAVNSIAYGLKVLTSALEDSLDGK
jgi:hypothetical protein